MASVQSFVTVEPGEWTQLCELRPTRQALLVQLIGGIAILGINTNGPSENTDFGEMPAGVFHSVDNGDGPGLFRLSAEIDGDLVQQQWSAWVQPIVVEPPFEMPTDGSIAHGMAPSTFTFTVTGVAFLLVMIAATGPVLPTIHSAQGGLLVPVQQIAVSDGLGDSAIIAVYKYLCTGGSDTLTWTVAANNAGWFYVYGLTGIGVDVTGENSVTGAAVVVNTTAAAKYPGEFAASACVSLDAGAASVPSAPWTQNSLSVPTISPSGSVWTMDAALLFTGDSGVQTVTWGFGAGATKGAATVTVAAIDAPAPTSRIITVIESFDVVDQQPTTFSVSLPKLSPDAIAALDSLLAKIHEYDDKDE
jgi:hypothetical protein